MKKHLISAVFAFSIAVPVIGWAQDPAGETEAAAPADVAEVLPEAADVTPQQAAQVLLNALPAENFKKQLRFNFSGAPWKEVLEYISKEADLALQIDQSPAGSVNFSDPTRTYSVNEALDLLNRLLLDRGHALVRRGRILKLIDLEAQNASKLISELAELVLPDQLEKRGKTDIVSSVFPLGNLDPEDARAQLPEMIGPAGRVIVMDGPRQVKVTETAEKLMAIRQMLEASHDKVRVIALQHRGAEEILESARPLLDLEPGENTSEDIKISIDLYGDKLYVTGLPGKVSILESLVEQMDTKVQTAESDGAEVEVTELRTHDVANADITMVFDVLQTLLQDQPDTRISVEPSNSAIIALARPSVHERITKVVAEMDGNGRQMKTFTLRRLDPATAMTTIQSYFGMNEESTEGPVMVGDPNTGKLVVRGTNQELGEIEKLIRELEGEDVLGSLGDKVRILPYSGSSAEDALDQVESVWRAIGRSNPIDRFPSRGNATEDDGMKERKFRRDADAEQKATSPPVNIDAKRRSRKQYHLVSEPVEESKPAEAANNKVEGLNQKTISVKGAPIVIQSTPAGLVIASDDIEALDAFEALLSQMATPDSAQSDLPTIYWLKYAKADATAELLASVLGGAESTLSSMTDSLTSNLGGGLMGGLMGLAGGGGGGGQESSTKTILTTSGTVNITADPRLNALFVQANATDLSIIDLVLAKVDRPDSPEDVQVNGKPGIIPVIYHDAQEIATIVKGILGDRIQGAQSSGGRGGGGGGQPNPAEIIQALRGGRGGRGGAQTVSEHPKIGISVDTRSNALIVLATPADFEQVRQLVEILDEGSKQVEDSVVTVPLPGNLNGQAVVGALEALLGKPVVQASEGTASTSGRSGDNGSSSGQTSASDIQRRIEAFRALRGGGVGPEAGSVAVAVAPVAEPVVAVAADRVEALVAAEAPEAVGVAAEAVSNYAANKHSPGTLS